MPSTSYSLASTEEIIADMRAGKMVVLVDEEDRENEGDLVLAADHAIRDIPAFHRAIELATPAAQQGKLVTFGIVPSCAHTGYGYIRKAEHADAALTAEVFAVAEFCEKPDLATATSFVNSGQYYWNSGMFCFTAGTFLQELALHSPDVLAASQAAAARFRAGDEVHEPAFNEMMAIPDISIDYGVMEKSKRVRVVPADIGWSDLGSFDALYGELPVDENGNTVQANTLTIDSTNNLLLNVSDSQLVTLGLSDLYVVQTPSATLIGRRGQSQDVKKAVDVLKSLHPDLLLAHESIETPFGSSKVALQTPHYSIEEAVTPSAHTRAHKYWPAVNRIDNVFGDRNLFCACVPMDDYRE